MFYISSYGKVHVLLSELTVYNDVIKPSASLMGPQRVKKKKGWDRGDPVIQTKKNCSPWQTDWLTL